MRSTASMTSDPVNRWPRALVVLARMITRLAGMVAVALVLAAGAAAGNLYVAENPPSELVRVNPRGAVTQLATRGDGLDNPLAVAFDPRPGKRKQLYITNSAYFGTHPSLEVTTTDAIGQRLP